MKCDQCKQEWSVAKSNSLPNYCPMCGAELNCADVVVNGAESAGDVVKKLVDSYGEDIIQNSRLFLALFGDLAPHLKREKKIFSISMSSDITSLFLNCAESERVNRLNRIRSMLKDVLSEEAACLFVNSVAFGLGWSAQIQNTEQKTAQNTESSPKSEQTGTNVPQESIEEKIKRADKMFQQKRFDEAEPIYQEAVNAGDPEGYIGMGSIYMQHYHDNRKALSYFEYAMENGNRDTSARAKLLCGLLYEQDSSAGRARKLVKASQLYERILDDEDLDSFFHNKALERLEVLKKQADNAAASQGVSCAEIARDAIESIKKGNADDIEQMLIAPLMAGEEDAWFAMALFGYKTNRYAEALTYLCRYLKRAVKKEHWDEAMQLVTKLNRSVLGDSKVEGNSMANEAMELMEEEKYDEALQLGKKAAEKGSAIGYAVAGECFLHKREYDEAAHYFEAAITELKNDPSLPEERSAIIARCYLYIGDCCYHKNDDAAAVRNYQLSMQENPMYADIIQKRMARIKNKSAAASMSLHDRLVQVLEQFTENSISTYMMYNSKIKYNEKKMKKIEKKILAAISEYAPGVDPKSVYVISDSTLFGSGKSGFLLTDSELYWNRLKKCHVKLSKIKQVYKNPTKAPSGFEISIDYLDEYNMKVNSGCISFCTTDKDAAKNYEILAGFAKAAQDQSQ